jgi:cysteine desulfurase / selenocysteine lyase
VNIAALRAATPGVNHVAHFNHAGASLCAQSTLDTISQHLQLEAQEGALEAAAMVTQLLQTLRTNTAKLLNCASSEVAFTSSAAASWGYAFAALPSLKSGDRILVSRHEWGGNVANIYAAARRVDASVEVIPCQADGQICVSALTAMLDERVKLVTLTWLPANGGLINPAAAIGRVCRAAGVPLFIDAGQALGQIDVDVQAMPCDVLSGAGRKYLRGPRGTGILYVRKEFLARLQPAFLDVLSAPWQADNFFLRDDTRRFETGETSVALMLGLGEAVRTALDIGVEPIRQQISALAQSLRVHLSATRGVSVLDLGEQKSGLVGFNIYGMSAENVRAALRAQRINVAANMAAYTPLDMRARGLSSVVRASVSYLNSEDDIAQLMAAIRSIAD